MLFLQGCYKMSIELCPTCNNIICECSIEQHQKDKAAIGARIYGADKESFRDSIESVTKANTPKLDIV